MSNGFGAAFGGLMLLAVLSGLSLLLGLFLVVVFAFQRRTGAVPNILRYLTIVVLAGAVLIAGFAVVALYDEAATLAAVFFAIVFVPLSAVGIYLRFMTELSRFDIVWTAGVAWSIPYFIGLIVTFGVPIVISGLFNLAPAESRQHGLYWFATALGSIVVLLGTLRLGKRVSDSFHSKVTH